MGGWSKEIRLSNTGKYSSRSWRVKFEVLLKRGYTRYLASWTTLLVGQVMGQIVKGLVGKGVMRLSNGAIIMENGRVL